MVEVNSENYEKYIRTINDINKLIYIVRDDTGFYSTHNHIFEHADFKRLVAMGDKIIPYLFHLITHNGGNWVLFHLIHQITKENPVPKGDWGKYTIVMSCWLQWYIDSDYSKNVDVYHNLID